MNKMRRVIKQSDVAVVYFTELAPTRTNVLVCDKEGTPLKADTFNLSSAKAREIFCADLPASHNILVEPLLYSAIPRDGRRCDCGDLLMDYPYPCH